MQAGDRSKALTGDLGTVQAQLDALVPGSKGVVAARNGLKSQIRDIKSELKTLERDAKFMARESRIAGGLIKHQATELGRAAREGAAAQAPGKLFGRSEERISIRRWRDTWLPEEDFDTLAEVTNTLSGSLLPPRINVATATLQNIGDMVRTSSATADAAMPVIQGLPLLGRHQARWAYMAARHWESFFDPTNMARYVSKNRDTIFAMQEQGIKIGDIEFFEALKRPGIVRKVMRTGPQRLVFERSQAAYDTGLTVLRVEWWKAVSKTMAPEDAGQFIRNVSGGLETSALGVTPGQRALEGIWMAFSPKLLRSTAAFLLGMNPTTVAGRESIRTVGSLVSSAMGFYIATGVAMGKDRDEILEGLNPLSGKKFLSHEAGGDWIGIGGTVRAITQLMANVIANPGGLAKMEQDNPLISFFMGRGAPVLNLGLGTVEALSGGKINALPYQDLDSPADLVRLSKGDPGLLWMSLLPFGVQNVIEHQKTATTMAGLLGARTSPQTTTEALSEAAMKQQPVVVNGQALSFGKEWSELTDAEQDFLLRANTDLRERRQLDQERQKARPIAKERAMAEKDNNKRTDDERALFAALQSGTIDARTFDASMKQFMRDAALRREGRIEALGIKFESTSDKAKAEAGYYDTFKQATIAPGVIDFELLEELQARYMDSLSADDRRYVEQRKRAEHAPEAQWYFDAKETLDKSGYYDANDSVLKRISAARPDLLAGIDTYAELLRERQRALRTGDRKRVALLDYIVDQVASYGSKVKEQLRATNPEVNDALVDLGRVQPEEFRSRRMR